MKKKVILSKLQRIFKKHNLPNSHSRICADYLLKAELINAQSHGLARLKMYCDRLKKGLINSKPKIKIKKISSSISHINADNSIGFVAADTAIKKAIKKNGQVAILIMDSYKVNKKNPFTFKQVKNKIEKKLTKFRGKYQLIKIPVVSEVIFGRKVGYKINKYKIKKIKAP